MALMEDLDAVTLVDGSEIIGFVDEGVSDSSHGGVVWHQMRLVL